MPLPNFLIVGAAKAGTSSLVHYLRNHPDVFLSRPSEPKYLTSTFLAFPHRGPGDDRIDAGVVRSLEDYRALFDAAGDASAIGEKSPDLLFYYDKSIPVIREVLGEPKIIIALRNPVSRTFSAYNFMVGQGRETLSFDDALAAEDDRLADNWEFIWAYRRASLHADAVAAYQDAFPDVHVLLLDDIRRDVEAATGAVFDFLGVDRTVRTEVGGVHNAHRAPRSQRVSAWRAGEGVVGAALNLARRAIPSSVRDRVRGHADAWNAKPPTLSTRQRTHLATTFADDIRRLERVIQRDLSAWG